jgi:hypothetical protein
MKILLVTRAGGRIQSKKSVSSSWLRVGRNASCEVHLPDPRVALDQGMVTRPDEGFMYVEGELGAQNITRKAVRQVRMEPGQPIEVGPYRLTLQPAPGPDYEAQLDVELVHPLGASSDLAGRSRQLTLGSLGLTKRWAAWLWASSCWVSSSRSRPAACSTCRGARPPRPRPSATASGTRGR